MYQQMYPEQELLETGIVSFRSLKKGFLPAGFKENGKVNKLLNSDLLGNFEKEFKDLLKEIFNPNIPLNIKIEKNLVAFATQKHLDCKTFLRVCYFIYPSFVSTSFEFCF